MSAGSKWQDDAARWWNEQHLTVRAITARLNHMRKLNLGEPEVRDALRDAGCGARSHLPVVPPTSKEHSADVGAERKAKKQLAEQEKADDRRSNREGDDWEDHDPEWVLACATEEANEYALSITYGTVFTYVTDIDKESLYRTARDRVRRDIDIVHNLSSPGIGPLRNAPEVAFELHGDRLQEALGIFEKACEDATSTMQAAAANLQHGSPVLEAISKVTGCVDQLQSAVTDLESVRDLTSTDLVGTPEASGGWAAEPPHERPTFYVSSDWFDGFAPVDATDPLAAISARLNFVLAQRGQPTVTLELGAVIETGTGFSLSALNTALGVESEEQGDFIIRGGYKVLSIDADDERAVVTCQQCCSVDFDGDPVPGLDDTESQVTWRTWRAIWDEHGRLTLR